MWIYEQNILKENKAEILTKDGKTNRPWNYHWKNDWIKEYEAEFVTTKEWI